MAKRRTRFITWCKRDVEDETPIRYTFKSKEADGQESVEHFTSEQCVSFSLLERIRYAWIESITLESDESGNYWNAVLYED